MKKIIDTYRKDLDNMLTLRDLHLSLVMGSSLLGLLATALLVCSYLCVLSLSLSLSSLSTVTVVALLICACFFECDGRSKCEDKHRLHYT